MYTLKSMRSDESASTRLEEITQEDTGHFSFKNTPLPGTKLSIYIYTGGYRTLLLQECTPSRY